jgi:site-specific DNA-methyltransferase (adenine-specific)
LTERVVIASKGRFDRAIPARRRQSLGLPSQASMFREEFMEATTDVWEIPAESATRVGHPAPFPAELPERLIHLYTYRGDLVLDPFMGSGSTGVAALRAERHYVGYDTDPSYALAAERRIADARTAMRDDASPPPRVVLPATPAPGTNEEDPQARAVREGKAAKDIARLVLEACHFTIVSEDKSMPGGVEVNFVAKDMLENDWYFDVSGGFTSVRPGLKRTDTLWKALGKAAVLHETTPRVPLVLLTTDRPAAGSAGAAALDVMCGERKPIRAVFELLSAEDQQRLTLLARGTPRRRRS